MSHELRTPLNSLLILSDQLCKNSEGNLTQKQVDFSKTIHSSGNDLLMLINDILDLSKIESGTVVVDLTDLSLHDLHLYVDRSFRHFAESKSLDFLIRMDPNLPRTMLTDAKRLQQIIKNLLSNAFKFTQRGQVTLAIEPVQGGWSLDNEDLNRAPGVLAFSVTDTGIGISADKQQIIFEAFQQADGSMSRKYGGTGLGLAISRELSRLLGGEIRLTSAVGRGSTFVLYLPQSYTPPRIRKAVEPSPSYPNGTAVEASLSAAKMARDFGEPAIANGNGAVAHYADSNGGALDGLASSTTVASKLVDEVGDDRERIRAGDRVLLIIENDLTFARFLLESCREKGFKGIVTSMGAAALALAAEHKPAAITLDIHLPDIDGWRVLARLKNDIATRHIPVCVISTDESRTRALSSGALGFLGKPLQSKDTLDLFLEKLGEHLSAGKKRLMLIEPETTKNDELRKFLAADDIEVIAATDAATALSALNAHEFDCVIVNPLTSGLDPSMLREQALKVSATGALPIVLYNETPHGRSDDARWTRLEENLVVRRVESRERLMDQISLILHRPAEAMPQSHRHVLEDLYLSNLVLAGKKVLIVDDDIRNIFALSSVLEEQGMVIGSAENGRDAIKLLQSQNDVDVVLMDIMMPEMDGIETMRRVRQIESCQDLPIIAVTAKAMKGDREKCMEAGAWDYLSKPVDPEILLAVLRSWLHR
jgi:CheY-like chemotaxis protein